MSKLHSNLPKFIYRRCYHYVVIYYHDGESIYVGRARQLEDAKKILSDYLENKHKSHLDTMEFVARKQFKKVGDDGLFPNHSDEDIWVKGFLEGVKHMKNKFKL